MKTSTLRRTGLWPRLFAAAILLCGGLAVAAQTVSNVLLFSFFRDNGQDGLCLAWSREWLKWTEAAL